MKIIDLMEARRNADHPSQQTSRLPHVGQHPANFYLEKYKDDPSIYVSFSTIPKLGINPSADWNTPQGIYFYPLSDMYVDYLDFDNRVPYAGDRPYMFIVRSKVKLTNVDEYTKSDFMNDLNKIKEIYGNDVYTDIQQYMKDNNFNGKTPAKMLWNVGVTYANYINNNESNVSQTSILSNFFRKLGHYGFDDRKSSSTISIMEPTQSVFFSTKYFEILEMITFHKKLNKLKSDKKYKTSIVPDFSKMSPYSLGNFLIDNPQFAVEHATEGVTYRLFSVLNPIDYKDTFIKLAKKYPNVIPDVLANMNNDYEFPLFVLVSASKENPDVIKKLVNIEHISFDYIRWVLKYYPDYLKYSKIDSIKNFNNRGKSNENK